MKPAQPIIFRDAALADVPAVVLLIESAYRGEASRAGWTTEADLLEGQRTDEMEVRDIIGAKHSKIRLAEQGEPDGNQSDIGLEANRLVGCVRIEIAHGSGYIGMVSVRPALQSRGIGRLLLMEAERVIRDELGLPRARMKVIGQRDVLIQWYERRGYSRTGIRDPFPYGQPRSGLPLRDDLYFEVLEKSLAPTG